MSYTDHYFAFDDQGSADASLPMDTYTNMLDLGVGDGGKYWRAVRIKDDETVRPEHTDFEVAPPAQPAHHMGERT